METRITPVEDVVELDAETRELLERLEAGGRPLNVFRTLARHPKLLKRWLVFGNHILVKSTLPARDRELLILRTAHRCDSRYEWAQHVPIALASGVLEDEITRISSGEGWTGFDRAVLRAVDELLDDHRLSSETWDALRKRYDERQMMDAVFTVGQYAMLAGALNSFGVQVEDGA